MSSKRRCCSVEKCLRPARKNGDKCSIHNITERNIQCPICLDNDSMSKMFPLSCCHFIHLDCAVGMNKLECPMCRERIINLPVEVKRKIEHNGKEYEKEKIEDERREIIEHERRRGGGRQPIELEIIMALKYLSEIGFPDHIIPEHVTMEVDPNSPPPPPGTIFKTIINLICNELRLQDDSPDEDIDITDDLFPESSLTPIQRVMTLKTFQGQTIMKVDFKLSNIPPTFITYSAFD